MENKKDALEDKEEIEGKPLKFNFWVISTIILAILLLSTLIFGNKITGNVISSQDASSRVLTLINKYFIQEGTASLAGSVTEESGLYKVGINYNGNQIFIYITKDGSFLILPNGIVSVAQLEGTPTNEPEEQNIPKTDKPSVELFVMSFCPYGVQAEQAMIQVAKLLGNKADVKIRFIANVNGDNVEDVASLHGINEAKEDLRQLAIMKYYPDKFWDYLNEIDANCYSVSRDAAKLDECWKAAAKKLSIDVTKIEQVAYSKEGIDLMRLEQSASEKYNVRGSPTLIINGAVYSGSRTSEAFKQGICSAFTTQPAECSQDVTGAASEETHVPTGSC
jgi:thiol-disulfide isomerase/thioredoxin